MKRTVSAAFVMLLISSLLFAVPSCEAESSEKEVQLLCLNIGKADCMLLSCDGQFFLIDTGYVQTYPALETALRQMGVDRLSGVFLTHCHKDHEGGLMPLAQSAVQVDAWYAPRIYYDVKPDEHPMALAAAARHQEVTWLDAGDVIQINDQAAFTVLGPLSVNTENENNNSLVMRFSSPAGSILFCGDMKKDEADELLSAQAFSPCDLLKVGHHGDGNTTSNKMLQIVRPKAAVILTSSQEEPDTPSFSTLSNLADIGCTVFVSQDTHDGILLTLKNGNWEYTDYVFQDVPEKVTRLQLSINMEQDILSIVNKSGGPLALSGCTLFSSKGNDLLALPDITLAEGAVYTVGSKNTSEATDLIWSKKRVWHESKRDVAVLYDAFGRPLACTDNGIPE